MFNKIKEIFGYNNNQKVITIVEKTPVVEEPIIEEERVLNISQPVHIIVEKIKQNPKRLKFKHALSLMCIYEIIDITTGSVFTLIRQDHISFEQGMVTSYTISHKDFIFTKDEVAYIIATLKPIYESRQKRLTEIKASRKLRQEQLAREKMQREWEES